MKNMDKNEGLSLNPDTVEFSREPSIELDPLKIFAHYWLTEREIEVLSRLAQGKTNKEIGIILNWSPSTVEKHLEQIYTKFGVESRTAAIVQFLKILHQAWELEENMFIGHPTNSNKSIKEIKRFFTNIFNRFFPVT